MKPTKSSGCLFATMGLTIALISIVIVSTIYILCSKWYHKVTSVYSRSILDSNIGGGLANLEGNILYLCHISQHFRGSENFGENFTT